MDPLQIKSFIDAMAASDLTEMEVTHDGWTLRLVRGVAADSAEPAPTAPMHATTAKKTGPQEVQAPMFGVVHLQSAPGEAPYVKAGDVIEAGQMLCTIEAMKVFNEVRAECGGRVSAVLVASGTEVEAGQALLTIEQVQDV